MFWLSAPTSIVCVTAVAALKFVVAAALAVTVHVPLPPNVTTPPLSVHVPEAPICTVASVARPVTALVDVAVGVYVPPVTGLSGTGEVNASV